MTMSVERLSLFLGCARVIVLLLLHVEAGQGTATTTGRANFAILTLHIHT